MKSFAATLRRLREHLRGSLFVVAMLSALTVGAFAQDAGFGTISGTVGVNTPTSTAFTLDNASLNPFYGNFLTQVQVQAYSPQTIVDNVSGISNLTAGNSVSISTLFLNNVTPPFQITKVRKH